VAWVYGPDYHDQMAMLLTQRAAERPAIVIFSDLYAAYLWLQQNHESSSLV
jgi:hypothetical protein